MSLPSFPGYIINNNMTLHSKVLDAVIFPLTDELEEPIDQGSSVSSAGVTTFPYKPSNRTRCLGWLRSEVVVFRPHENNRPPPFF